MIFLKPQGQGFSNFASLFSFMKDKFSVVFLAQTSYTLDKNTPSKWNFRTFEWLGENSPNSSSHIWNWILLKLYLIFNLIIFSAKVQNFRLSTARVKFDQICTLIGYFCWKYIKFQLKKHGWVMSHDTKEWYKIWRETYFLFQKWQKFDEFWSEH